MLETVKVSELANALYRAHGDRAEAEAARREGEYNARGNRTEAQNWRRIRAAIRQRRGAPQG